MDLKQAYSLLTYGTENGGISKFVVLPDGKITEVIPRDFINGQVRLSVVPGSFNPLTRAHRWLFDKDPAYGKCFEMSVKRWDKPNVSFEELEERVAQFYGYAPVLITNQPRIIGKIAILRETYPTLIPTFHIGADTLIRMYDDYGKVGVGGLAAKFVVHDRILNNQLLSIGSHTPPFNCSAPQVSMPDDMLEISSTKIRLLAKTKD